MEKEGIWNALYMYMYEHLVKRNLEHHFTHHEKC